MTRAYGGTDNPRKAFRGGNLKPLGLRAASLIFALLGNACSFVAPEIRLSGSATLEREAGTTIESTAFGRVVGGSVAKTGSTVVRTDQAIDCLGKSTDVGVTGREIKIGSAAALSGPIQQITAPAVKGIRAYINRVNERGGVHGRKIRFLALDDGWDSQRGRTLIKQLVNRDRVFALTLSSSNGLDAATSFLGERGVPVLGASGSMQSQFTSPVIWPVGMPMSGSMRLVVADAIRRLHARTFSLIWVDVELGAQGRQAIAEMIRADPSNASLVAERRVSLAEPTFEPVWNDLQNQTRRWQTAHGRPADGRADFVIFAIDPANAVKALQSAQRLGIKPKLGWGAGFNLFFDLVLHNIDYAAKTGLLAGSYFTPATPEFAHIPAVRDYIDTIRRYVEPKDVSNPLVELGWVAVAFLTHTLDAAGPCLTRKAVMEAADAISGLSIAGLTQPMAFRRPGNGFGRYANTWGLTLQVVPKGTAGCSRTIGCWHWVRAPTRNGWYQDPIATE